MESYNVAKFVYLMELFPSWSFSIFILATCMFLSNTRFKPIRLLVGRCKHSKCIRDVFVRLLGTVKLLFYCICMYATRLKIKAANIPPPKKKKWYVQNLKERLEDPELKDWLRQDAKNLYASYCVCCEVQLNRANKSMVIAHMKTAWDKKSFAITKSPIKLDSIVVKETSILNIKVARAD